MDHAELARELERLHGESFGWALCCCMRDQELAEDVVQETYVKILGGKAKYDGRAELKTWLFAVIRRTAADERRRRLIRKLRLRFYEPPASAQAPADVALYRSEFQDTFRLALANLPRRQREVLQLVFYHEMSLSQAAAAMGVSLGSARTHYDRGKQSIRETVTEMTHAARSRSTTVPRVVLGTET